MLRADAAEENTNIQLAHDITFYKEITISIWKSEKSVL
jgi:hypothetical protein